MEDVLRQGVVGEVFGCQKSLVARRRIKKKNLGIPVRENALKASTYETLMHATTWTNLENIMLSGRRQIQKVTYGMIPSL